MFYTHNIESSGYQTVNFPNNSLGMYLDFYDRVAACCQVGMSLDVKEIVKEDRLLVELKTI